MAVPLSETGWLVHRYIVEVLLPVGEKPPKVTEVVAQTVVEPLPRVSSVATTTIPVAPPASLINPDKPVAMASAPAHVSTASALTKQKLLQNIQMKEQQKLLENVLTQQLGSGSSHELLAQALKNIIPQVQVRAYLAMCGFLCEIWHNDNYYCVTSYTTHVNN